MADFGQKTGIFDQNQHTGFSNEVITRLLKVECAWNLAGRFEIHWYIRIWKKNSIQNFIMADLDQKTGIFYQNRYTGYKQGHNYYKFDELEIRHANPKWIGE